MKRLLNPSPKNLYLLYKTQNSKNSLASENKNLCDFKCTRCAYTCSTWSSLKKHVLVKKHGPLEGIAQYLQKIVFYKCSMCDEKMPCDKSFIQRHFHQHKLTVKTYYSSVKNINSEGEMHKTYLLKLQTLIEGIPSIDPKHGTITNSDSLPDNQVTKHIGNICFFQCSICSKSGLSFSNLRYHCKLKHNMETVPYNVKNVTEARYHRCHICLKIILCDSSFIIFHLRSSHKITLGQYKTDYVKKGGWEVLPTFWDYQRDNDVFESLKMNKPMIELDQKDSDKIMPWMLSSESEDSDD